MQLINFDTILPRFAFTSDMLDFDSTYYDEDIICIPLTSKVHCINFNPICNVFEERMRKFYFEETWDDEIIDGEFSLVIWNENGNEYSYRLQFLANDCSIELQVCLDKNECELLSPIIQKAFGKSFDLNMIRNDVAKTFGNYISKPILDRLKLVSDRFVNDGYRSAWITSDNQSCIVAKVKDCSDVNCPVEIVKFGC